MVRVTLDELASHCYTQIKEHAAQSGCSVLLLVAPDTDALAACRILTVRPTQLKLEEPKEMTLSRSGSVLIRPVHALHSWIGS